MNLGVNTYFNFKVFQNYPLCTVVAFLLKRLVALVLHEPCKINQNVKNLFKIPKIFWAIKQFTKCDRYHSENDSKFNSEIVQFWNRTGLRTEQWL